MRLLLVTALAAGALVYAAPVHASTESRAICATFRSYCSQALAVARCESGLSIWARNGQYLGLFQVSARWRATVPGWGMNAWAQARHAYKVFKLTGSDWSPWTCRP